jgi:hypothetical protein
MHACITANPTLEKPPNMMRKHHSENHVDTTKRQKLLQEKLRLNHVVEGADEIRSIFEEYIDIFKLSGDSLTVTTAAEHTIKCRQFQKVET